MNRRYDPELEECMRCPEEASSIPPSYYTSEEIVEAEQERIFRRQWIGVGRRDMVENPGDFVALDIAGQHVILLRSQSGDLRAYANTCRHRGARLVDGSGTCKGLRCPFHSWFYSLDGELISAPEMEKVDQFDRADYGLIEYRAEERFGFVFICLCNDAEDIDIHLGDFSQRHDPWPLESLVTVRRQVLEANCNWKVFLEVFNEYYHLPSVHADSINNIYSKPDSPDLTTGSYATQFGATEGTGGLLQTEQDKALPDIPGLSGEATRGARYTWVFPNMTFAANRDALWCYEAYPLGAAKCLVVQTSCFPAETMLLADFDEKSVAYLQRMDAALFEDIVALENQQKGLSCVDAKAGRFQPDLEPNVASFANWYSRQWIE